MAAVWAAGPEPIMVTLWCMNLLVTLRKDLRSNDEFSIAIGWLG